MKNIKVKMEDKLDIISLKLPHKLIKKINGLAKKEDRSRSSLIRKFLTKSVEDYQLGDKTESSFVLYSNQIFSDEWESEDDDKAFSNLQKYNK